ncbi:MAG: molybdopterin oxidoreductase [Planctomycetes bacterium]|nr:molybdopterin oxidoreductase [Planctomycetota bacterium]
MSVLARIAQGQHLAELDKGEHEYDQNDPENIINTVCLGCNTGCPIKTKIKNGTIVKIDGNPYGPWGRKPHLAYKTPLPVAARTEGVLCPKGQSGMMTAYDPYRLRKVLKRDGARGSMKWKTIDFHQAVEEIVKGGRLFAHVPGEEDRGVEGLNDLWALRDPRLAGEMSKEVDEIWKAKTPGDKKVKISGFQEKFREHLGVLIDPDHPDFGPRNNQFLWIHGRLKAGRSEFFKRFVDEGLGSSNFHGHTTVCQGALYFAGKAMSAQWAFDEKKAREDWVGGDKFYWQADQTAAEFILFVGASPFEANYGPPSRCPSITEGLTSGRLKIAVVDPRLSKTAAKAWKWLPARPGTEGALALAMIRWVLDNDRHDKRYLGCANKAAAAQAGEPNWSNASWLVKVDDGQAGAFLRASDLGLAAEKRAAKAKDGEVSYEFDPFVVLADGKPAPFDPNDAAQAVRGDLLVDAEIGGRRVKSVLQLLAEESRRHSVEQWAAICGVEASDIIELAREFTSHGKKAAADIHRGAAQHTNGFYNCLAFNSLNLLIGNYDWRGGMVKLTTYDITGAKAGGPFNIKAMNPRAMKPFGLGILRERKFEETTLFEGKYPSKRPWFPHATDVYQELLPSVQDEYPYPIKALLLYMGTPGYSLPAGQTQIQVLADTARLPLFIASDIVVGESSMYADYIFPDLSFYERWECQGSHPNNIWKVQPVRQPAIAPIPETVKVFGQEMPICLEAFMLAVAEKMGLPGFGPDGFGNGQDFLRPEDFYLRLVANLAYGEKADGSDAVADAGDEELAVFLKARRHLPASVFDPAKWQAAVGPHWRRVVTVLNRGGRFQDYEKAFDGEKVQNKYGKLVCMYSEKVAKTKYCTTGRTMPGVACHLEIADCMGQPLVVQEDELHLITHREIFHTKSRTPGNPWLRELMPENFVLINTRDAGRLGLRDGDRVRVTSRSNPEGVWKLPNFGDKPMVGKIRVTEGIRPGVVSFSLGHGHWAYGASDIWIDGAQVAGDPRRGTGVHANAAMAIDPHLKNVCLQDLVGGSVSFYDSPVRLVKL